MRRLGWFGKPAERRAGERVGRCPLTASYWGARLDSRSIRDIDAGGAFIESPEPWRAGTLIHIVLVAGPSAPGGDEAAESFGLWAKIVRSEAEGMAVQFIHESHEEREKLRRFLATVSAEKAEMQSKKLPAAESGQALVETALVLPMLLFLVLNVVNFGAFLHAWITVANAARTGAQYMVIGSAMVTAPGEPADADVIGLVRQDLLALPNRANAEVRICEHNQRRAADQRVLCTVGAGDGTVISRTGTIADAPPDPESSAYVLARVTVRYDFEPLVPMAGLTLPPARIQQFSDMRRLR